MRVYEPLPKTPYQRLLENPDIAEATKRRVQTQHAQLHPIQLKQRLEAKLRNFFTLLSNLDRESTKA
jgi:hypothetical protein